MTAILGTFRFDRLLDYGDELDEKKAGKVIKSHFRRLNGKIEKKLKKRNKRRLEKGQLTLPYLLPSWLPNGVQA